MREVAEDQFIQLLCSVDEKNVRLAFELAKGNLTLQAILDDYIAVHYALFQADYEDYMFYAGADLEEVQAFSVNEKDIARTNQSTIFHADFVEHIPSSIRYFTRLSHLKISGALKVVPRELGQLANLAELDLCNNKVVEIPKEVGQLQKLEVLNLQNNCLTNLPSEIKGLKNLDLLFLQNNPIAIAEQEKINNWLPHCSITY